MGGSPPLGPRCTQKAVLVHILRCIGKGKSNLLRPPFSVYSGPLFRFTPGPFSIYSGHLFSQSPAKTHPRTVYSGKIRVYSGPFSGLLRAFLRDIFEFTPGHFRVCSGTFSGLLRDIFLLRENPGLLRGIFGFTPGFSPGRFRVYSGLLLPSKRPHFLSFLRNCPKAEF